MKANLQREKSCAHKENIRLHSLEVNRQQIFPNCLPTKLLQIISLNENLQSILRA